MKKSAEVDATEKMEEKFRHKLDTYYLATIGYGAVLVLYVVVTGTLIGNKFELVWKDPIVYLLAACAFLSLIGLLLTATLNRKVLIRDRELVFRSRFKEKIFTPEDVEWIGFRRESKVRTHGEQIYPAARIKLRNRRTLLWLRPGGFERGLELVKMLKEWARNNDVELRVGRRQWRKGRKQTRRGGKGE